MSKFVFIQDADPSEERRKLVRSQAARTSHSGPNFNSLNGTVNTTPTATKEGKSKGMKKRQQANITVSLRLRDIKPSPLEVSKKPCATEDEDFSIEAKQSTPRSSSQSSRAFSTFFRTAYITGYISEALRVIKEDDSSLQHPKTEWNAAEKSHLQKLVSDCQSILILRNPRRSNSHGN